MARNGTDFGIQVSGHRRPVVHRPGQHAGGALPRRRSGRRTPTPTSATRRSPRPAASAASRWPRRRRSCGSSAARWPTRSSATRLMYEITLAENPAYQVPVLELPRHADRHRRRRWWCGPGSCRRSTPAWPAGSPAPARSAPGWSTRRRRSSRTRSPRSPRSPRRLSASRPSVGGMRAGFILPGGTAPKQLEQALAAEAAGWDAVVVWEAGYGVDPWVCSRPSRRGPSGSGSARS